MIYFFSWLQFSPLSDRIVLDRDCRVLNSKSTRVISLSTHPLSINHAGYDDDDDDDDDEAEGVILDS